MEEGREDGDSQGDCDDVNSELDENCGGVPGRIYDELSNYPRIMALVAMKESAVAVVSQAPPQQAQAPGAVL